MEAKELKWLGRYMSFISNNGNTGKHTKYTHLHTQNYIPWGKIQVLAQRNWGLTQAGSLNNKIF